MSDPEDMDEGEEEEEYEEGEEEDEEAGDEEDEEAGDGEEEAAMMDDGDDEAAEEGQEHAGGGGEEEAKEPGGSSGQPGRPRKRRKRGYQKKVKTMLEQIQSRPPNKKLSVAQKMFIINYIDRSSEVKGKDEWAKFFKTSSTTIVNITKKKRAEIILKASRLSKSYEGVDTVRRRRRRRRRREEGGWHGKRGRVSRRRWKAHNCVPCPPRRAYIPQLPSRP